MGRIQRLCVGCWLDIRAARRVPSRALDPARTIPRDIAAFAARCRVWRQGFTALQSSSGSYERYERYERMALELNQERRFEVVRLVTVA